MVSQDCAGMLRAAYGAMRLAAAAIVVLAGSAAHAQDWTVGASLGVAQSKADASSDSNNVVGLYGRLGLSSRVAVQLELQKFQTDDTDSGVSMRSGTAAILVDLAAGGSDRHFFPTLLAGVGIDHAADDFSASTGHHIEGGIGLELRTEGGFVAGVDLRIGSRSIESPQAKPIAGTIAFAPSHLSDGEYRAAHVTVGIRF
jgi:outer membrane protein with beta-barrel domain